MRPTGLLTQDDGLFMQRAFLFCPENDIALGRGCARFTPPRQAALLACYGAPLMWWLGDESDYVVVPEVVDEEYSLSLAEWERDVTLRIGAGPRVVTSLAGLDVDTLCPWGWSGYTANKWRDAGVNETVLDRNLPDLEKVRMLSHRRSATVINQLLAGLIDWGNFGQSAPAGAAEAATIGEVERYMQCNNRFYAKSPWSSSGRGVVCSDGVSPARMLERCAAVIREQGSVMLEPFYDKVLDFAMLFECNPDGNVCFHGYSQFYNARSTAYTGNLLVPDSEIIRNVATYIDISLLGEVRRSLESVLTGMLEGAYRGFLGVDMMVAHASGGTFFLIPCVELNLRMTMGVVARAVSWRIPVDKGFMQINPGRPDGCPDSLDDNVVQLVPTNRYFNIQAVVGFFEE